jgi:hypothetical protein
MLLICVLIIIYVAMLPILERHLIVMVISALDKLIAFLGTVILIIDLARIYVQLLPVVIVKALWKLRFAMGIHVHLIVIVIQDIVI